LVARRSSFVVRRSPSSTDLAFPPPLFSFRARAIFDRSSPQEKFGITCPLLLCSDHLLKNFFKALLDSAEVRAHPTLLRATTRRAYLDAYKALLATGEDVLLELHHLGGSGDRQNSNAARAVLYNRKVRKRSVTGVLSFPSDSPSSEGELSYMR